MTPPTSIAVYDLTEADLLHDPVWQFCTDAEDEAGVDESHVSPNADGLRMGSFGSFIVRARYVLGNGQELPGAVQVDLLGSKLLFAPAFLCVQGKQLDPVAPDVEKRLLRITKIASGRPVSWRLEVAIAGESTLRAGRISQSRLVQAFHLLIQLVWLRFIRRGR